MINKNIIFYFIFTIILLTPIHFIWAKDDIVKKYGCKNLHEIQSGEDALKQLYDNLNTDCFAKIPEIELEEVWGIKVYDFDNPNSITKNMNDDEFYEYLSNWFFKGKMAEKIRSEFKFDKDKNSRKYLQFYKNSKYLKKHDYKLITYNDKFPKILPNPLIECNDKKDITGTFFGGWIRPSKEVDYGIYSPICRYLWKGEKNELEITVEYPIADRINNDDIIVKNGYFKFIFFINDN